MKESERITNIEKESKEAIRRGLIYTGMSITMSCLTYFLSIIDTEGKVNTSVLWFAIGFEFVSAFLYIMLGFYFDKQLKKGYVYRVRTIKFLKEGEL